MDDVPRDFWGKLTVYRVYYAGMSFYSSFGHCTIPYYKRFLFFELSSWVEIYHALNRVHVRTLNAKTYHCRRWQATTFSSFGNQFCDLLQLEILTTLKSWYLGSRDTLEVDPAVHHRGNPGQSSPRKTHWNKIEKYSITSTNSKV